MDKKAQRILNIFETGVSETELTETLKTKINASTGGSLGSIKPTDAAPTPARNGNYTFSIGGNKPAWLTAEAGITTVKAGDGVAVVYTAPSGYSYTHVDANSYFKDRVEIANKSFLESTEPSFTNDELAVIKAIKSIKVYNANPARKYLIRFLCNNDSTFKYNINITDKITGVGQTKAINTVATPGGLNFLTLSVILGSDSPVTIKLAIDYSSLSNRVYMNVEYSTSNLVLSKQTYTDVKTEDLTSLSNRIQENTNTLGQLYIQQNNLTWSSGYWPANGTLEYFANYGHSSYLKVKPGATISASGLGTGGGSSAAKGMNFFDANFVWICYSNNSTETVDSDLSANYENISYVSFSTADYISLPPSIVITINNNTQFEQIDARVDVLESVSLSTKNKSLAVLGDSIMMLMRTGTFTTQAQLDLQNWDALKLKLQLSDLINCGLGSAVVNEGSEITSSPYAEARETVTTLPNEVRWLKRMTDAGRPAPDAVIIWIGTNNVATDLTGVNDNYDAIMALDWAVLSHDINGAIYRKTFYGGLRFSLESIYRNYKYATVFIFSVIMTDPTNRRTNADRDAYLSAYKKMGGRYSAQVIDAYHEIGIVDLFEKADGTGYFLFDGLHPNNDGKILITNYVAKKMTSLYFDKKDV